MISTNLTIDLTYLYSVSDGNTSFMYMLLASTIDDVEAKITNLKTGYEERNVILVKQTAHSLISLAAIAGIPEVESMCRKIEKDYDGNPENTEISGIIKEIILLWPDASLQLKDLVAANTIQQ
jgi:HPt (histidine-containing phosphotransfer) domain-containing protein